MAVPAIQFAYLSYDRNNIIVVCKVDAGQTPLKLGVSATNGWTVLFNGVTQSLFTGIVASPRPNCVTIALDSRPAATDVVKIYYTAAGSQIQDQAGQLLATILSASAITVDPCWQIVKLIAKDVVLSLGDITTANGYIRTLNITDNLKDPATIADGLVQVDYDDPALEDDGPINHEQFLATFHAVAALSISDTLTTPLKDKGYQIEADILKALNVDYTRSSLAVDTIAIQPTWVDLGVGGWAGISVNFNVRFRTLYGNRFDQ